MSENKNGRLTVTDEQCELVVKLRDDEELKWGTIAKIMGMSMSGVKWIYHRTKQTPQWQAEVEKRAGRLERAKHGRTQEGMSEGVKEMIKREYAGADVRRLWRVLQGTSRIMRGEVA